MQLKANAKQEVGCTLQTENRSSHKFHLCNRNNTSSSCCWRWEKQGFVLKAGAPRQGFKVFCCARWYCCSSCCCCCTCCYHYSSSKSYLLTPCAASGAVSAQLHVAEVPTGAATATRACLPLRVFSVLLQPSDMKQQQQQPQREEHRDLGVCTAGEYSE